MTEDDKETDAKEAKENGPIKEANHGINHQGTEDKATHSMEEHNMDVDIIADLTLTNDAPVASGVGKPKESKRDLDIFWKIVWPKLEEAGWTKLDGSGAGALTGVATFLPKGSWKDEHGLVSGEQFDSVHEVLDRLDEGRSQTEVAISNLYYSFQNGETDKTPTKNGSAPPPSRPAQNLLLSPKMDLTWKEGRIFPRKTSLIGEHYQVSDLPTAGTFRPSEESECVIVWDTQKASSLVDEYGNLPLLEKVPSNKLEAALELLAERDYLPGEDFVDTVIALPARNGSDWSPEKKAKFSELVFSLRKDLHGVRVAMDIDMSTCLAHYYGVFKHTDDYRLVSTVLHDEKLDAKIAVAVATISNASLAGTGTVVPTNTLQDGEPDACYICDDGGELLICDGCEREYHMECTSPPLRSIPEGHWECDECVNQKLLAFRDYLIRRSGLFEPEIHEGETTGTEGPSVVFKPTPDAMAAIRVMAEGISKVFSTTPADVETMDEEACATPKAVPSGKDDETGGSGSGSRRKRKRN